VSGLRASQCTSRGLAGDGEGTDGVATDSVAGDGVAGDGVAEDGEATDGVAEVSLAEVSLAELMVTSDGRALDHAACRCQTWPTTVISSGSATGRSRHHVRGSDRYLSCELISSGSRLFSSTGRVASQVASPGGRI
jgi:hypothetical protein